MDSKTFDCLGVRGLHSVIVHFFTALVSFYPGFILAA